MTSPAERDDVIERLLKALQADSSANGGGDCLDADTLARWADGKLSGDERGVVLAHAVACARCQALLAAMVRTEPPRIARPSRRFPSTLVRWALPLAAAAALALWIAVDREALPPPEAKPAEPAPSSAMAQPPVSPATPSPAVEAPRSTSSASADANAERDARAEKRTPVKAPDAPAGEQARLEVQDTRAAAAPPAQTAAPPPAETVVAPTATESLPVGPQAAPQVATEAAKQIPTAPQAATQQVPGGGLAETVAQDSAAARGVVARRFRSDVTWVEVPSPEPLIRWRFTPGGDVERSADAGLTWMREQIGGARVPLIAGAAPSSSVCWLTGRDGVVLRFTSAEGWQRVPLPVRAHVISIVASDAQNAIVRVQDAQFRTTDGGKTWR